MLPNYDIDNSSQTIQGHSVLPNLDTDNSYSDYSSAQYVANLGNCQLLLRFFKHIGN